MPTGSAQYLKKEQKKNILLAQLLVIVNTYVGMHHRQTPGRRARMASLDNERANEALRTRANTNEATRNGVKLIGISVGQREISVE